MEFKRGSRVCHIVTGQTGTVVRAKMEPGVDPRLAEVELYVVWDDSTTENQVGVVRFVTSRQVILLPNPGVVEAPTDAAADPTKTTEVSFQLRPSSIGGVGVFAMHGIMAGTLLRLFTKPGTRQIPFGDVKDGTLFATFVDKYGVMDGKKGIWWVPHDFGGMDVGWYLNHSDVPNAKGDGSEDTEFYALRDIGVGEEITINYEVEYPDEEVPTCEK